MAKPMTKTQLVAALAEEMGTDKKAANAALEAVTGLITREVSAAVLSPCPASAKSTAASAPSAWCATPPPASSSRKRPTRW